MEEISITSSLEYINDNIEKSTRSVVINKLLKGFPGKLLINTRQFIDEPQILLFSTSSIIQHHVIFWNDSVVFARDVSENQWDFIAILNAKFMNILNICATSNRNNM